MHRRAFLTTSATLLAAGCAPALTTPPAPTRKWGLQLFTVVAPLESDFEGTLRKVSELGYKEVETIGSFGRDPAYLRAQLDRFGLISPSQHIAPDKLYASFGAWSRKQITTEQNTANYEAQLAPENVISAVRDGIAKAQVLGQTYVTWPILMDKMLATLELVDTYIKLFNEAGRICREEGVKFGFHHHAREFKVLGPQIIYDRILERTDPTLVHMEMDFYWITKAGKDATTYLSNNAGRFYAAHVKDMDAQGGFQAAGSGTMDLPRLITAARGAGVKHFFVEIDRSNDPMKAAVDSIGYLKSIG